MVGLICEFEINTPPELLLKEAMSVPLCSDHLPHSGPEKIELASHGPTILGCPAMGNPKWHQHMQRHLGSMGYLLILHYQRSLLT